MRSMLRVFILAAFALAGLGCAKKTDEIADPTEVSVQVAQEMEKAFAEGREARSWLGTPGNVLFEMGNAEGREWTDRLYAAGATVVKICEADRIAENQTGEISATLGVGFPDSPAKRAELLKVFNQLEEATDNEPSKDMGQKFEMVSVD